MTALMRYDQACRAIAEARSVDEVKDVRNKADAMRLYARQARNRAAEIAMAEIRIRAEHRLGELIIEQKQSQGLNAGGRPVKSETCSVEELVIDPVDNEPPFPFVAEAEVKPQTLADLGVDRKLSMRAQRLASTYSEAASFESALATWRQRVERDGDRVTINLVKQTEQTRQREDRAEIYDAGCKIEDLAAAANFGTRYGVIYADPPWEYRTWSEAGSGRSASQHYDTMPVEAIKALPVQSLAADDCMLILWATWPTLPQALELIEAWGFTYKTCAFDWAKQNKSGDGWFMGNGHYTRANTEPCLLATRGRPARLVADVRQLLVAPVGLHSEKPAEARARIERLAAGPYLELFAREEVPGWTVWGNEIARETFQRAAISEGAGRRRGKKAKATPATALEEPELPAALDRRKQQATQQEAAE